MKGKKAEQAEGDKDESIFTGINCRREIVLL